MDELEISGRRYISSRRAGKENKYHADYIGQLIRAKKVEGQKVGRAWYVDAESLAEYLGKETAPRAPLAPVVRVVEKAIKKPEAVEIETPLEEDIEEPIAKQEEAAKEETRQPEVIEEIKIDTTPIYRTTREAREARGGLRYIADESPLIPPVQKQIVQKQEPHVITIKREAIKPMPLRVMEDVTESPLYVEERYEEERDAPPLAAAIPVAKYPLAKKRKSGTSVPLVVRGAAVLVIGALVFAVAAFASTHLLFTVTVDGGQSANAGYSVK